MWTPMTCLANVVSLSGLCSSLMIKIMSKRDKIVGMKLLFSSALVLSHMGAIGFNKLA